jgi:hypothetical protein
LKSISVVLLKNRTLKRDVSAQGIQMSLKKYCINTTYKVAFELWRTSQ